ncbi:MAG: hypothetical protein HOW73_43930 [Polyangiaceae bacterium]|nr:hypothetical protein [Polyangiaceae bacterium]
MIAPSSRSKRRAAALLASLCATVVLASSCSLVFPVDDYEDGGPSCGGSYEHPPLSDISATFDDGVGEEIALLNCAQIVDGAVSVEDFNGDYCWFYTVSAHRLTCDSITVRLVQSGSQETGSQRFIYVREVDGDGALDLLQEGGGFGLGSIELSDSTFTFPEDAWWRLSATEDDVITFSTSADGVEWRERGSGPAPFSLENVYVAIGGGNWNGLADPGENRFDCFNVAPPCP